jgi:tetratricopeptide (TPR) repeat protein
MQKLISPLIGCALTISPSLCLMAGFMAEAQARSPQASQSVSQSVSQSASAPPNSLTAQATINQSPPANQVRPYSAEPATDWDALFDRASGWTGGDGAYAIPLSGDERPGAAGQTFWTFNDTFIGQVNNNDDRIGAKLVRNTHGLMTGNAPNPNQVEFFVRQAPSGNPSAWFKPDTQSQHWFWLNDGVVANNKLYIFALRMKPIREVQGDGLFDYAYDGISLLSDNLVLRNRQPNPEPMKTYQQVNTPLYVSSRCDRGSTIFGQSVMSNTPAAGAPKPDGYIYLYGVRNDLDNKKLVVSRVLPEEIEDFTKYQYWNGQQWGISPEEVKPMADHLSSEFSVSPLADGRYILVYQVDDFLSQTVAVRYANNPTGPWSEPIPIWNTQERDIRLHTFTYGAKAHPHLSQPGELLISYQRNTFKNSEQYDRADIYRPRFLRLPLTNTGEPLTAVQRQSSENQQRRAEADRLVAQATQQMLLGQYQPAQTALIQASETYKQIGDRAIRGIALNKLGAVQLKLGQYQAAFDAYEAAAAIHQTVHNRVQEGISLDGLGQVHHTQQLYAQALQYYNQALPIRREVSDRCGEGQTLSRMGRVYSSQGQAEPALVVFKEALPIHQEVKNRGEEAMTLRDTGDVQLKLGQVSDARKSYRAAIELYELMGDPREVEATQQRLAAAKR